MIVDVHFFALLDAVCSLNKQVEEGSLQYIPPGAWGLIHFNICPIARVISCVKRRPVVSGQCDILFSIDGPPIYKSNQEKKQRHFYETF